MKKTMNINGTIYELANLNTLVNVDRDMCWHGGKSGFESWFIVSNLKSQSESIGLQVHVLINCIPEKGALASINVSVVNETTGWYKAFEFVYPADQLTLGKETFNIQAPKFKFSGDSKAISVYAEIDGGIIDICSKNVNPVLLANGQGYLEFLGVDQYDYAFSGMETVGKIILEDKECEIFGISWFDRQWGDVPEFFSGKGNNENPFSSMQWIWMNPQLNNGVNISLSQIQEFDKKKLSLMASIVKPDGMYISTQIEPIEKLEYWTSPRTGNKYPTKFIVRIPSVDAVLTIEVPYKEQEIVSKMGGLTKYEGAAIVIGTFGGLEVNGECYVELVGYWK